MTKRPVLVSTVLWSRRWQLLLKLSFTIFGSLIAPKCAELSPLVQKIKSLGEAAKVSTGSSTKGDLRDAIKLYFEQPIPKSKDDDDISNLLAVQACAEHAMDKSFLEFLKLKQIYLSNGQLLDLLKRNLVTLQDVAEAVFSETCKGSSLSGGRESKVDNFKGMMNSLKPKLDLIGALYCKGKIDYSSQSWAKRLCDQYNNISRLQNTAWREIESVLLSDNKTKEEDTTSSEEEDNKKDIDEAEDDEDNSDHNVPRRMEIEIVQNLWADETYGSMVPPIRKQLLENSVPIGMSDVLEEMGIKSGDKINQRIASKATKEFEGMMTHDNKRLPLLMNGKDLQSKMRTISEAAVTGSNNILRKCDISDVCVTSHNLSSHLMTREEMTPGMGTRKSQPARQVHQECWCQEMPAVGENPNSRKSSG